MSKHYVAVDTPTIHHSRSRFDLSYDVKTSGNVGTLYPFYLQEIYPGDTFNCDSTFVTRLSTSFFKPVMDNLFLDVYYFFVPSRLVFSRWEEIFGENKQSAWVQPAPVEAPNVGASYVQKIYSGSVGDYLGLPLSGDITCLPTGLNVMPFRAFAKIYDDWFRDQNLQQPMLIQTGDWTLAEDCNNNDWSPSNYMGKPPRVSKFHDIFTSALPSTQKASSPIKVPLVESLAPVIGDNLEGQHSLRDGLWMNFNSSTVNNVNLQGYSSTSSRQKNIIGAVGGSASPGYSIDSWNLYADLANAGQINVTDLRYAFQLQRILERSARVGTRYTEYLLGAFGVSSPDARLQRSEYLGGKRMPLSVQQVAQTTPGTSAGEPLGNLAAFSLSNGRCGYQKGFVEHGFVIGVFVVRQHHTYQQGIERFWQRKARFDYYDPILANISEVPVYKSELYGLTSASNPSDITADVFGYQEAWYDLRKRMSIVTGAMRTGAPASFDVYHFGDYYANAPTLNFQFTQERPDYVDRTIPVNSSEADQFLFDIFNKQSAIRVLPTYSIPGLVDHH